MSITRRSHGVLRVIVILYAIALCGVPAVARAASFSSKTPSSSSYSTSSRPTISVSVYDGYGVRGSSSYWMKIDGMKVKASLAYTRRYTRFKLAYRPSKSLTSATHNVTVWVKNWRGRTYSVTWSFKVKGAAPVTASDAVASYEGTATIHLAATRAASSGSLKPTDSGLAIARTHHSLDGAPAVEGTTVVVPQPLSGSVVHSLTFWSTNVMGMREASHLVTFIVTAKTDFVPPSTFVEGVGRSAGVSAFVGDVELRLTPVDAGGSGVAHTYVKRDNEPATEGTAVAVAAPSSGSQTHSLQYWSVDAAGNVEDTRTFEFSVEKETAGHVVMPACTPCHGTDLAAIHGLGRCANCHAPGRMPTSACLDGECHPSGMPGVDVTPPHTTAIRAIDAPNTVTLSFLASDDESSVAHTFYRVDGASVQEGVWLSVMSPVPEHSYSVEYWSVDVAGNEESHTTEVFSTFSETDHPVSGACIGGLCHANDGLEIHRRVVGPGCAECHTPGAEPTFECRTCHALENISFAHDHTAPVTTSDAVGSYSNSAVIHLNPGDGEGSGVARTYYSIDGGTPVEGTVVEVSMPVPGSRTVVLSFWSVDVLGNTEACRTVRFTITRSATPWEPIHHQSSSACTNAPCHGRDGSQIHHGCATCHAYGVEPTVDCTANYCHASGMPQASALTPPSTITDAAGSYVGTATICLSAYGAEGIGDGSALGSSAIGPYVAHIYHRLDGGQISENVPVVVAAPLTGSQSHTLEYWSVDATGKSEDPHTIHFVAYAPGSTSPADALPAAMSDLSPAYTGPASIHIQAPAGLRAGYRLDDGPYVNGTTVAVPAPISGSEGHRLEWYLISASGEAGPIRSGVFTVSARPDYEPPATILTRSASAPAGFARFVLTATDEGWGVAATYFNVYGGSGVHEGTIIDLPIGPNDLIMFWSVDKAGNVESQHFFYANVQQQ